MRVLILALCGATVGALAPSAYARRPRLHMRRSAFAPLAVEPPLEQAIVEPSLKQATAEENLRLLEENAKLLEENAKLRATIDDISDDIMKAETIKRVAQKGLLKNIGRINLFIIITFGLGIAYSLLETDIRAIAALYYFDLGSDVYPGFERATVAVDLFLRLPGELLHNYEALVPTNPVFYKACTSGVAYAFGDFVSQVCGIDHILALSPSVLPRASFAQCLSEHAHAKMDDCPCPHRSTKDARSTRLTFRVRSDRVPLGSLATARSATIGCLCACHQHLAHMRTRHVHGGGRSMSSIHPWRLLRTYRMFTCKAQPYLATTRARRPWRRISTLEARGGRLA